jgi:3-hydroxybutyryl-CoA dehydrogenase
MKTYLILGTGMMGIQVAKLIFSCNKNSKIQLFSETGKNIDQKLKDLKNDLFKLSNIGKFKYKLEDQDYQRLSFITDLKDSGNPDFIFECLKEDKQKKLKFLEICSQNFPNSIISTNTSSLSVNDLSNNINLPERFFGCHFFNPVLKTRFAEIILNNQSCSDNLDKLQNELNLYLKDFVITRDSPGFIVNKVLISMIESGLELHIKEGINFEDIDRSLKIGANFISGPFEIADRIGLDVVAEIMKNINKTKYIELLNTKISSNELGKKTGRGFYNY